MPLFQKSDRDRGKGPKRITVPMSIGGMYSAGDAGSIPDDASRLILNMIHRPNRLAARPPFAYDNVMAVNGLANFDDLANNVTRLCSVDTSQDFRVKNTSGETWSSANATDILGTRITDFANYRGILYAMVDDGTGLPSAAFSFDGTNINTSPFNSAIQGRTVTVFNDRLFIAYPRVSVAPLTGSTSKVYDWTDSITHLTSVSAKNFTTSGITSCRLYPTATTGAKVERYKTAALNGSISDYGFTSIAASATPTPIVWRQDLRATAGAYSMPVKLEVFIYTQWDNNFGGGHAWLAGDLVADSNGNLQRCTTAGTGGVGGAPAWATAVGSTTADAAAVWTVEQTGSTIALLDNQYVPMPTPSGTWSTYFCVGSVPLSTNPQVLALRLSFGNTTTPTITLAAIDVSLRDGITDGDPRKKNYGTQITQGDFYYPFFNQESTFTATVDMPSIVWSEIGRPKQIRAANTFDLIELAGYPTAAATLHGRYFVFKRNGFWVFQGQDDPDNPIVREMFMAAYGCIGPQALDTFENEVFFIGENDIYRYKQQSVYALQRVVPEPMCGDGMREEIMNKSSSTWVESQSTYKRPLLKIDKNKLIVWVYTQKGVLYAYDLREQKWSKHQVSTGTFEVDAMLWNPNTQNMYVSFGGNGLTVMDYTTGASTGAKDTIESTLTQYVGNMFVMFKPIELYEPPRYEATLEEFRILHAGKVSGQLVYGFYSFDQGKTFPKQETFSIPLLSANGEMVPLRFHALQTGGSVTIEVQCVGKLGEAAWTISPRAFARLHVRAGEYLLNAPTGGSGTL